jgi:hypothetical protein
MCLVEWQTKRTKKAGIVGKYGNSHSLGLILVIRVLAFVHVDFLAVA